MRNHLGQRETCFGKGLFELVEKYIKKREGLMKKVLERIEREDVEISVAIRWRKRGRGNALSIQALLPSGLSFHSFGCLFQWE